MSGVGAGRHAVVTGPAHAAVAPDPWTEGPNLAPYGNYEDPVEGPNWWSPWSGLETFELETGHPIAGNGSLRFIATGADVEGGRISAQVVGIDGVSVIDEGARVRARFKLASNGANGEIAALIVASINPPASATQSPFFLWHGAPTTDVQSLSFDIQIPGNPTWFSVTGPTTGATWGIDFYLLSFSTVVDVLVDDVYLGVLTPA